MESEKKSALIKKMGLIELEHINLDRVDKELTMKYQDMNVIFLDDGIVTANMYDRAVFELKSKEGRNIIYIVNEAHFNKVLESITVEEIDIEDMVDMAIDDIDETELDDTEVNKLLNKIIYDAIKKNVSDVHIIPKEKHTNILFRYTGDIILYKELPKRHCELLVNKLKTKGNMDITKKMVPQDGKTRYKANGITVELRIATLPTLFGENAVLRVQQSSGLFDTTLLELGFFAEDLQTYRKNFSKPYGMILNVGATGSGKTTTFYLTIKELVDKFEGKKNIMTVEDPVEIQYPPITQIEVDDRQDRSFAKVLKSLLRQDPDIILIGEIRDQETAGIGVKASLTGHLVLATLHANDSFNAITRLRDLGITDPLISSTLNCIISQRLVKRLCPHCKEEEIVSKTIKEQCGLVGDITWKAVGCEECENSGYIGREAIVEVLDINEEFKTAISNQMSEIEIKKIAKKGKFNNLWINAMRKVESGITTIEQAALVINQDAIINSQKSDEENVIIDTRKVFYPNTKINVAFKTFNGDIFDVSKRGISIVFDDPHFLDINKEYPIKVEDNNVIFIPKSYGEASFDSGKKFLVGGIYKGDLTDLLSEN